MSDQPDSMIEPATDPTNEPAGDRSTELQHVTVEYDEDIAVCTMFPAAIAEDEIASAWLTASGESFVALADCR
ncbi:hypothetical protein RBH26_14210 [Natronolimnohabitans sp. A-GB9]|uniref:DUF7511 domain-containing protein n=1 Tax=Natronolimnohabitans sp. A-GB9 TaxID=3069757 RepID=UPI0027B5FA0E|nr:hypothetical protein [Natronolimnohabitans sp. A-GB9]MDQ2051629.1 hypothetical protein [Natronolimnohabitans sp. A-GB9]